MIRQVQGVPRPIRCAAVTLALVTSAVASGCGGELADRRPQADEAPWTLAVADLVFMSDRDGNAEIYLLAAGDTAWVNLTNHPAGDNWPAWSPDGERIAFHSTRTGNLDIWVMNADGSNARRLTHDPAHDYLPEWSPDGTRLTFASWRTEPGDTAEQVHLYTMNADGTDQRRLFPWSPKTSTGAVWAPDGRSFAVTRRRGEGTSDILIVEADGTILRRVTDDDLYNGSPAFSPDGTRLAFYASRADTSRIVVSGSDGTERQVVVGEGQNWYPRWSPDGRWLVFTAAPTVGVEDDLDVLAVPAEGGDPITLVGGPGRETEGRWRPFQ